MTGRTVLANEHVRRGRMNKAEQFSGAAGVVRALADDPTDVVETADRGAAAHLGSLLRMKSRAGYDHQSVSHTDVVRAGRAVDALLGSARDARG